MKIKFIQIIGLASVVLSAFTFTGCVADSDSAGLEYMPDMYRSPAIEPYVDYAEIRGREKSGLKTKLSAMTPPLGTIPFYGTNSEEVALMLPYFRNPSSEFWITHGLRDFKFSSQNEYELAKEDTQNPLALTPQNAAKILKEGKEIYSSKCMHCHGEKGDGNGPMVVSQAYNGVPNYADRSSLSNGQIFYSIYYGKGSMGAHGSMLDKKEIWTLVHYVRKLQNKDYGTVKDGKVVGINAGSDSTAVKSTKTEKK
ncbi:MAG: c-type cytochrome [Bacteroidota bacterium]